MEVVAHTSHCATQRSCAASTTRRRPPAQERAARSLSTRPSGALSSTTATRQASATMPTSWPRCRVPQSNMQPPFAPSAAIAAKSCERTLRGRCQLQQQSQGGFEMQERLTRDEGKVRGGRQTYSARHLIDLAGSACLSSMICVARKTHVPAVLQRVSRYAIRTGFGWLLPFGAHGHDVRAHAMCPSYRHGCGVAEAAVAGTCV